MLTTIYGTFDGNSWEELCQRCFKIKYEKDGYQEIKASPGDFGIEGFTRTGLAFQCYCPDMEYTQKELYEKVRDKITDDIKKLKTYEKELSSRLSGTLIKEWHFVTPPKNINDILVHIAKKKNEVRGWKLSILTNDFDIQIKDIDFFSKEITQTRSFSGEKLQFDSEIAKDLNVDWSIKDTYLENINRKNGIRLGVDNTKNNDTLNNLTFKYLVDGDERLKKIMNLTPSLYYNLSRLFNQYELEVTEKSITWRGTAEELIEMLKIDLEKRLNEEMTSLSSVDRLKLINHIISKWIAICPLNFEED